MPPYRARAVEPLLSSLLREVPAVLLVGPRATGKTTTALRAVASSIRLDRPTEAAVVRADPDAALRGLEEPVLLDEWQVVPEILGAVKRAVDSDPRPGRFLLTGSMRADMEGDTWAGTGRVIRVPLYGMTIAEQVGRPDAVPLLDRIVSGAELAAAADTPDLRGYAELALRSGYPQPALQLSGPMTERWLESYVDQVITRDATQLGADRDPARLRRYLEAYALNSAGNVEDKTLYEAAGINRKTAVAYEGLLINLMLAELTPAWTSNRLKRLTLSPKRYLVDAALIAGTLRLDVNGFMRDANLLGRLLDTFVMSQIRAQLPITKSRPRLYHVREQQGRHEIDLLAELGGQQVIGIEVKADAAPGRSAGRHLVWLRERLGDRFRGGVVLHSGTRSYQLEEKVVAASISTLWA